MNQPTPDDRNQTPTGLPRWVKMSGLIAILLAAAFLTLHLTGNAPSHGGH